MQAERALKFSLVIPFAVEDGANRLRTIGRRAHQPADVGRVAPKISAAGEVFSVAEGIREKNPVDPAGRRPTHDVQNDFGIRQFLDEPVDAVALNGVIELLRNPVDVDRQRNTAVHDKSNSRFAGSSGCWLEF